MEFNKKTQSTSNNVSNNTYEVITLKSSDSVSTITIPNAIKIQISTTGTPPEMYTITHDVADLLNTYKEYIIKTSLCTVYGQSGRLYSSSKSIESFNVLVKEIPLKLEYKLTIVDKVGNEIDYSSNIILPTFNSTFYLNLYGSKTISSTALSLSDAVNKLDEEIISIKSNLQSFSFFNDFTQNKVVSLHSLLTDLLIRMETITKDLNNVKKKVENL